MANSKVFLRAGMPPLLITLATAAFALRDAMSSSAVPAYLHDWFWPMTAEQLRQAVYTNIAVWNSSGLGAPSPLPVNHPIFWFWHFAALFATPAIVLDVTLLGAFVALGIGTYAFVRRVSTASRGVAVASAVCVMLGPPLFSKLLAGHVYYIVAFAMFPWAFYAFCGRPGVRAALCAGVLVALTIIQPQLYAALLVALLALAFAHRPMRMRMFCIAAVASVVLALPSAYLALVNHQAASQTLAQFKTVAFWEYNNSAHFSEAIIGLGYAPRYAEHSFTQVWHGKGIDMLLYVVPALAAAACVTLARIALVRAIALLWLLFLCLVMGFFGPLAAPLSYLFAVDVVFSALRELYHFAAPMWLFACVLMAFALSRLPKIVAASALALALTPLVALWVPPHFGMQLRLWSAPPALAAQIDRLAHEHGGRFLALPAQNPVAPDGAYGGGLNPIGYAAGSYWPVNEYAASPQLQLILRNVQRRGAPARRWLTLAGVDRCLSQSDVKSVFARALLAPRRWPAVLKRPGDVVTDARICPGTIGSSPMAFTITSLPVVAAPERWNDGPIYLGDDAMLPARDRAAPQASSESTDPSTAWVRSSLWSWIGSGVADAGDTGVITWSNAALNVPSFPHSATCVQIWALRAGLMDQRGVRLHVPNGWGWTDLPAATRTLRRSGDGVVVIAQFASARERARYQVRSRTSTPNAVAIPFDMDRLSGQGSTRLHDLWVVLKERYSPLWRVEITGGRVVAHVLAGGYANAWHLQCPSACRFTLDYAPARAARVLIYASLWLWLALVAVCAILWKTSRNDASLA